MLEDIIKAIHQENGNDPKEWEATLLTQELTLTKALIGKGADIHVFDDLPLVYAAKHGRIELVKFFLEKDLNVNSCDDLALKWAAREGHFEVVKLLVESGANIYTIDDVDPIERAGLGGHQDVVEFLTTYKKP